MRSFFVAVMAVFIAPVIMDMARAEDRATTLSGPRLERRWRTVARGALGSDD